MNIDKISKTIYKTGAKTRDIKAVEKSIKTHSLMPIIKRFVNKWIGRHIVRRLWWK